MLGQWQPYPDHPQVAELIRELSDLQDRALEAVFADNLAATRQFLTERKVAQQRLDAITSTLLRDESLMPRWVACIDTDAAENEFACVECGNRVRAEEIKCSYCGWTYIVN